MKLNIGVIFGGKSVEHEISIISAVEAMGYIDESRFNVVPIYIDKENNWYTGFHFRDILNYRDIALVKRYGKKVRLIKENKSFYLQSTGLLKRNINLIDLVLPIGHGAFLEDGSLQGYLKILGIPFAGSDVMGSAIGQDKVLMKQVLLANNINVTNFIWFYDYEYLNNKKDIIKRVETLKYPLYVKPASLGSSIGISKVINEESLNNAIKEAIKYDNKILIEEAVKNTKEVNVSVLGNYKKSEASDIEEINVDDEFFTFKEKYIDNYSKNISNKKKAKKLLSKEMIDDIKSTALKVFYVLNASGVARIDFLIDEKNKKFYVSEINTIPGSLSSFLWLPKKKTETELINDLLDIAVDKYKDNKTKIYAFDGNLLEKFDTLKGNKIKK